MYFIAIKKIQFDRPSASIIIYFSTLEKFQDIRISEWHHARWFLRV